jgi:hypothetical protein
MSRKTLLGLLVLTAACVLAGSADAQTSEYFYDSLQTEAATPDGQTPSEENVCDGQTGAAFGLCNAYCEAMDCDSGSPEASDRACARVGEHFERLTGGPPPCGCPCVGGVPGFIEALNGELGERVQCLAAENPGFNTFVGIVLDDGRVPGAENFEAFGFGFCGFAFGSGGALQITSEEANQCLALVRSKADQAGLECGGI